MVQAVGVVAQIWRYPVKSMRGERLSAARVGLNGLEGDRSWAIIDEHSGRVLSAKKYPQLLGFAARGCESLGEDPLGVIPAIVAPDGTEMPRDSQYLGDFLTKLLGRKVKLGRVQPGESFRAEIDPNTVFGDVPWETMKGTWQNLPKENLPDFFTLPVGSFFDAAPLHLLTTATLQMVQRTLDQDCKVDVRRFRPNFLVETLPSFEGLCEEKWVSRILKIGKRLEIEVLRPVPRCVMTTCAQAELPRDPRVLRTVAKFNRGLLGVFCRPLGEGYVHEGDIVELSE